MWRKKRIKRRGGKVELKGTVVCLLFINSTIRAGSDHLEKRRRKGGIEKKREDRKGLYFELACHGKKKGKGKEVRKKRRRESASVSNPPT